MGLLTELERLEEEVDFALIFTEVAHIMVVFAMQELLKSWRLSSPSSLPLLYPQERMVGMHMGADATTFVCWDRVKESGGKQIHVPATKFLANFLK